MGRTAAITALVLTVALIPALPARAQEPPIASEIRQIAEDFGYDITVSVVNNRYTGMQDLFVTPAQAKTYESAVFIHGVCAAVAQVTAASPSYQTFVDMVMIEVNGELWAVSTANCRKAFRMNTVAAQKVQLGRSLQRLR